jgi:hypothetical protein
VLFGKVGGEQRKSQQGGEHRKAGMIHPSVAVLAAIFLGPDPGRNGISLARRRGDADNPGMNPHPILGRRLFVDGIVRPRLPQ